jgi:hypothetical protein
MKIANLFWTDAEGIGGDLKLDIGKCILIIDGIEPHAKAPSRKDRGVDPDKPNRDCFAAR